MGWGSQSLLPLFHVSAQDTVSCTASGLGVLPLPAPPYSEVREKEPLSLECWTSGLGWNATHLEEACPDLPWGACWLLTSHYHVLSSSEHFSLTDIFMFIYLGIFGFVWFLVFLSIISLSPYLQQHIISSIEEGTHLSGSMPHPQHPAQ